MRAARLAAGVEPTYKTVDTCAAEFDAAHAVPLLAPGRTRTRWRRRAGDKVIILGSGPNRIGQGIEFDYGCVHASFALADAGFETVMVNCNPETVSTDYDTSDRLYFEPLTYRGRAHRSSRPSRPRRRPAAARWWASSCRSAARRRSSWPTCCPAS